jgi:5-methylcytosine-specific restriction endonuclease McrA
MSVDRNRDKAWAEQVLSVGECQLCGAVDGLQAHHILSRRFSHTRHDIDNGICVCQNCHAEIHAGNPRYSMYVAERKRAMKDKNRECWEGSCKVF